MLLSRPRSRSPDAVQLSFHPGRANIAPRGTFPGPRGGWTGCRACSQPRSDPSGMRAPYGQDYHPNAFHAVNAPKDQTVGGVPSLTPWIITISRRCPVPPRPRRFREEFLSPRPSKVDFRLSTFATGLSSKGPVVLGSEEVPRQAQEALCATVLVSGL